MNGFWQIFLFEIKYRLKRVDTYLYFAIFFFLPAWSFANGWVRASEKIYVNAGPVLADYFAMCGLLLMIVTAAIMGTPLYRDLEYNTHEYYLSYPITKNDYFWGRFWGSFLFVMIIAWGPVLGSLVGTLIGPKLDLLALARIGPYHLANYLQPYLVFILPNVLLTSAIFFGLVAYTRNVKVVYTSGVIFYLAYMTSLIIFHNLPNPNIVYELDAMAIVPIQMLRDFLSSEQQNNSLIALRGGILINRLIWTSVGIVIIAITYYRFNFVRFFSGRADKKINPDISASSDILKKIPAVITKFAGSYNRKVLYALTRIELTSILRDTYFRLILGAGIFFLGFVFWHVSGQRYGVWNFPRTVDFMNFYDSDFMFFIFLIILFYAGETVHREKTTRFAIINDALPPANWVLYSSKLLALFFLAVILATIPFLMGIGVQLARSYTNFNFPTYLISCYAISLPRIVEMIMLCFAIHVVINNRFAGIAVGLIIWTIVYVGDVTGKLNYKLLLYSYTPGYDFSDMDGLGPTAKPIFWFTFYWLFCGSLLLVLGALFYYRGIIPSFKERLKLAVHRFDRKVKWVVLFLLLGFLATGTYNYYNLSYLNEWLTPAERDEHKVAFEKQLKKYASDPLPTIIKINFNSDIFPEERKVSTKAFVKIANRTNKMISRMLLDGDQLSAYSLASNGQPIPYSNPLIYPRAKLSFFRSANDTSMYRLYELTNPLRPGDTTTIEINSLMQPNGFNNGYSFANILKNGTIFFGGLPELGYDDGEELSDNIKRKQYGLAEKKEEFIPQDDSAGMSHFSFTDLPPGLTRVEATISTSADQSAIAPGYLEKSWQQNGRNYYHYVLENPIYPSFPIMSARYSLLLDSVKSGDGQTTNIELYYHREHNANLSRFMNGCKDAIGYLSKTFGSFPFRQMRLAESSIYTGDRNSFPDLLAYSERYGWNVSFDNPDQFDYCYFFTLCYVGNQWWLYQTAPNHTIGSEIISDGLSKYGAFLLFEKKYGIASMKKVLNNEANWYLLQRRFSFEKENPMIESKRYWEWDTKAGVILYELKELIGEDSLNASLREFHDAYAFRDKAPFAGSNDLYRFIKKRVPDSLQYYLTDSWEKITIYDNKILDANVVSLGEDKYKVQIKVSVGKTYTDSLGNDKPAAEMNDYIDIGIFAAETKDSQGHIQDHPAYLQKHRFTAGEHTIDIIVNGKPASVGIDPYGKLIDRRTDDNLKTL